MKKSFGFLGATQATSYGPFRYVHSIIVGFVAGNIAFLVGVALNDGKAGIDQLPILLACSLGGTCCYC